MNTPPGQQPNLDDDIALAHAKVKAHQRKSLLAMAVAMVVALPFFLLAIAFNKLLVIPGGFLGVVVWKKLRPANANPLADI